MKKQINEVRRMQVLAGILKEENDEMAPASGDFPVDPRGMARLVADKFAIELRGMPSKQRHEMALSHAYEIILNSGHPKAETIARNLVWGYSDEDWPTTYIDILDAMLIGLEEDSAMIEEDDDEDDFPDAVLNPGADAKRAILDRNSEEWKSVKAAIDGKKEDKEKAIKAMELGLRMVGWEDKDFEPSKKASDLHVRWEDIRDETLAKSSIVAADYFRDMLIRKAK